ncbi:MAG: DUF547 domain-containing protein [Leptolyngbyaceae cyanobacterium]
MIDFAPWDTLLRTYVDDRGRVDYERWQQVSKPSLDDWLRSISETSLEALDQTSAIAFLINLYNALTIQQVLQRYPIDSIRPTLLGLPNWWTFFRFFTKDIYMLRGRSLSLNAIEHDILRAQYSESRIHFALVCASEGCPWLRAGAYWPDKLHQQLDEEAHQFIHNPEKVRYQADSNLLYCSKIFKWYSSDFCAEAETLTAYINQYQTMAPIPSGAEIAYLPYSWQLNQRTSS